MHTRTQERGLNCATTKKKDEKKKLCCSFGEQQRELI
jgi:hypothetical protein